MCFKMLMWTILVLGSYLQGAYAEKAKSTSSTSTIAITPTNTGIIPAAIKTSLNETTTQSTPTTISISTILTAKLPTAKVSTTGPTTIAVKTEASSPTTNSIPTDPQSAIVTIKTPEPKDTTIISTSATSALFNATSVTASTILTSNVTNGTDAPSDQSTLKNSLDTVTISSPTGFNLTTTTNESLVNHSAADKIPTTNSKAVKSHATTHMTKAETTATTSAAATTTSAAATTASAAATTASAAATTASAAATTTSAASAAATTTSAAATTKTSTAAAAAAAAGAGATRTATTITTRTTAATSTTTTTSIKPQSQAMEPKLIAMEVTPNTKGTIYEQICALLTKNKRKTVNCTINGCEIDGDFIVESIQLPSLPRGKDQKHPTTATPPKTVDSGTPTENQGEDTQMTLIAILASSGALALILIAFAVYCSCHRLSYRKNQQHLTEELQTVENGYHDNPTLEVMEVQPEVQEKKFALEKKLALNGEFNDSWIVPFDNLAKDDIPDEEDTHL